MKQAAHPLALALLLGTCLSGCAPGSSPAPGGGASADAGRFSPPGSARQATNAAPAAAPAPGGVTPFPLQVFVDGFEGKGTPLRNGGVVALPGGLSAAIFLDPYPPVGASTWLDLYLATEGQPLQGAEVALECEMLYMSHGALRADAKSASNGHYGFDVKYPMAGLWRQRIAVRLVDQRYELPLLVTVYP